MPVPKEKIEKFITSNIKSSKVQLTALVGDDDHYAVHVISKEFAGKSRLERHRMVYKALEGIMSHQLHALQISTSEN